MIYFVTRLESSDAVKRLQVGIRGAFPAIRLLTYEELFHTQQAPVGHYIFTDQDRLSTFEIEVAQSLAGALQRAEPAIRILNYPGRVLERFPLLRALQQAGVNRFEITRLDDGTRPVRYPVFVRCEDHHLGADTDLLGSPDELEQALAQLQQQGKVLKRRVAVEFCAERTSAGFYRKYGAIHIDGEIIPQHIIESEHWLAKADGASRNRNEAVTTDELNYIRDNPHRDELRRIFELARIDYGRVDYGIVDGRLQVYEINTNPHLPRLDEETHRNGLTPRVLEIRAVRRDLVRHAIVSALQRIDEPLSSRAPIRFPMPTWKNHQLTTLSPRQVRFRMLRYECSQRLLDWRLRHPTLRRWMPFKSAILSLFDG